jgi:predicted helicase
MSQLLIQQYLNELSDLRRASGSGRESIVSEAFKDLLKGYAKSHDLIFLPQYDLPKQDGNRRTVDGALVYDVRVPFGYWEAKDEEDDLDKEIAAKLRRGYPRDNIIFEDSKTAVLMQYGNEVMRCPVDDTDRLPHLIDLFFEYERPEVADFRKAVAQFQTDLPQVLEALRSMIEKAQKDNSAFRKGATKFLKHAQETINPAVTAEDVREMLIQHVLTEDIFSKVFDEDDFHRNNNVAKELYALEGLFFTGPLKKTTLKGLESYYNAIRTTAHQIATHTEKQTFLKVIYEGFYKVYNKKAADRLGVVYTPNEIVRFMVESADWLCQKHFGKALIDKGVEILDPATGTGTFICELMEHFRGQKPKLARKYKEELHANEVAILPYYVANLNIEATYAAITGQYAEFPNLCFVDTLDNVAGLGKFSGHQEEMFGAVSEENVERIKRQNARKISVIIGNPPYNANQQSENDDNKNRAYPKIDQRISATYIHESTAQKTKAYDMYTRFFRWASDRLREEGIIAFVSNRNFIDGRNLDGFRKAAVRDFQEIWIVDLKGNARTSGEQRRKEGGNVFDDQIRVGIAVYFCVRNPSLKGCRIFYETVRDYAKGDEKRDFLSKGLCKRKFEEIVPDALGTWIEHAENDFGGLLPIASKQTKLAKSPSQEKAIFGLFASGIKTNRDEWVYDPSLRTLAKKIQYFLSAMNSAIGRGVHELRDKLKLSSSLRIPKTPILFSQERICDVIYRPFIKTFFYSDVRLSDRLTRHHYTIYGDNLRSRTSCLLISVGERVEFMCLGSNLPPNYDLLSLGSVVILPISRFVGDGEHKDNVTDWALEQFCAHYEGASSPQPRELAEAQAPRAITKNAIFHYVYGVLHDPIYREKYGLNLKREFPRIPFYPDFWRWADWGKTLMVLHIGYETVQPWKLERIDVLDEKSKKAALPPKPSLKADKENGIIVLDSETQLTGVPAAAWTYRLGNRSALEWILDQYKEKSPKDPTIREKFNTYRFADHKEKVIDLLKRVTRVSVETMKIVEAMKAEKR